MGTTVKIALAAIGLSGALLAAGCVVAPGRGEVAFGYSDGYWDRDHHWHAWANDQDATRFRAANRDHYYDRKHDEDQNQGWRDSDRYWEHR